MGRAVFKAKFKHTGATQLLSLFIQRVHCDTFKQTRVADCGIHKVFNSTFVSALLKLNV